jgi:hypothetical protein
MGRGNGSKREKETMTIASNTYKFTVCTFGKFVDFSTLAGAVEYCVKKDIRPTIQAKIFKGGKFVYAAEYIHIGDGEDGYPRYATCGN